MAAQLVDLVDIGRQGSDRREGGGKFWRFRLGRGGPARPIGGLELGRAGMAEFCGFGRADRAMLEG